MTFSTFVTLISLLVAAVAGWLLRAFMEKPRTAAAAAVHAEREGRLEAELGAAKALAESRDGAPAQVSAAMVPVHAALSQLGNVVARGEEGRAESTAILTAQLRLVAESSNATTDGLRRETARLVGALGRSEVRGRWGEMQLRRLLECSGLIRNLHFTEQYSVKAESGMLRPDVILHVGGQKDVVIDAKVSLNSVLSSSSNDTSAEVAAASAANAREVRAHVDRLANKNYAAQFQTSPEFVVMFLPSESVLAEALVHDPDLLEHAFRRNVVPATPTTLLALLRTVSHVWRQEDLAANAREIQSLGRELAERLATMVDHLGKVGSALDRSVKAYNSTVASLESRVLVSGRRFAELQGLPPAATPDQVDITTRTLDSYPTLGVIDRGA